jgi:aspartyl/asparaginyl-tRNA synthetase
MQRTEIRGLARRTGVSVTIAGFVTAKRVLKSVIFLIVEDSTASVQVTRSAQSSTGMGSTFPCRRSHSRA